VEKTQTVRLTVLMRFCRLSDPESEAGTPRLKKATQLSRGGGRFLFSVRTLPKRHTLVTGR
jgi:hypothetical protein